MTTTSSSLSVVDSWAACLLSGCAEAHSRRPVLHVLGGIAVRRGELEVALPELDSGKNAEVLLYLLAHDRAPIAKTDLAMEVWAEAPPSNPSRAVENAVSRIRRILDPLMLGESAQPATSIIRTVGCGYQWNHTLATHHLRFLAEVFTGREMRAHLFAQHPAEFVQLDARHFGSSIHGARWADTYRTWLEIRLQRLHLELVRHYLSEGRTDDACSLAELAFERYPWSEDALALVMVAYSAAGDRSAALQTYRLAESAADAPLGLALSELAGCIEAGRELSWAH
jgi:DNA-binding SARP family transcriptional activator